MPLTLKSFSIGPYLNNSYLLYDPETRDTAVIDPAFNSDTIVKAAEQDNLIISKVWITHAHFDHIAGVALLRKSYGEALTVGLHPADLPNWKDGGASTYFGINIDTGKDPEILFYHGQVLKVGIYSLEIRHTPGHTPGHVIFYDSEYHVAYVGDLIFQGSVGRTDLPGGDYHTLIRSIRTQVFTLPNETRLLSGHGPETTVLQEKQNSPFFR